MRYQKPHGVNFAACLEFQSQRKGSRIDFMNFNAKNPCNLHVIIKHQTV